MPGSGGAFHGRWVQQRPDYSIKANMPAYIADKLRDVKIDPWRNNSWAWWWPLVRRPS